MRHAIPVAALLLSCASLGMSNEIPDPGGSNNTRFNTLFTFGQNRQHYRSTTSADSAVQAQRAWPGETWQHYRRNVGYFILWKAHDGTILSGNPQWWNLGYQWRTDSYGAFVTGATDATLIRSGSGTTASPYTLRLNLTNNNYWTGTQSFKQNLRITDFGGEDITVAAPVGTAAWTFTLPSTDGLSGQFLQTNGSGVTTWAYDGDYTIGNEVVDAANGTLVRSGLGTSVNQYKLAIDTTRALNWLNNVDVRDTVKMGDGTNYTMFEADGSMQMVGNATVWDDLRVPVTSVRIPPAGVDAPDFKVVRKNVGGTSIGVAAYAFDPDAVENLFFTVQIPHGYKLGTNLTPHVHWTADATEGNPVEWGLEYTIANHDSLFAETNTIYAKHATVTAYKHHMTNFTEISGANIVSPSCMLICRIFRNATDGTDDTYTDDAFLLEIDFHYEMDTIGSRTQSAK